MKLQNKCPKCNKQLKLLDFNNLIVTNEPLVTQALKTYECGHTFVEDPIEKIPVTQIHAIGNDKIARNYQIEGVEFHYANGMNTLNSDEMGIGKTAQALLALRNNQRTLVPCLTIVKSAITYQWQNEGRIWFDNNLMSNYIITSTKGFIPPGFKNYIISMDTFSRMIKFQDTKVTKTDRWGQEYQTVEEIAIVSPALASLGIKSIIVDECHSFKNPSSMRTKALIGFVKSQNIKFKHFLSGTPIKNRADEYFTVLNLLDPEKFPSLESFQSKWLSRDSSGKYSRITHYLEDEFREEIKHLVLRREKKDIQMDLPDFQRDFQMIKIDNTKMVEIYNQELEQMRLLTNNKGTYSFMDIQECLMRLRKVTGMMKVEWAIDEIEDFLESCEGEKIAIGVHHHMVRDALYGILKERGHKVLKLSGEDNSEAKERIKKEFAHPDNRILIINMLAGGVGMDGLQVCNNVICLERQWNSADEEQFEARFWRSGQLLKVMAKYPLVKGTIDEFFANMVESKRFTFGKTISNDWNQMGDPVFWKDLVNETLNGRL